MYQLRTNVNMLTKTIEFHKMRGISATGAATLLHEVTYRNTKQAVSMQNCARQYNNTINCNETQGLNQTKHK